MCVRNTASEPQCTARNIGNNQTFEENETFTVDCTVNYTGEWFPKFHCEPETQDKEDVIDVDVTSYTPAEDYVLTVNVTRDLNGRSLECWMTFNASNRSIAPAMSANYRLPAGKSAPLIVLCKLKLKVNFEIYITDWTATTGIGKAFSVPLC